MPLDAREARRRRSSSLVYTEPPESLEQLSDQSALPNLNAQWVNAKGKWFGQLPGVHMLHPGFRSVVNIQSIMLTRLQAHGSSISS